jgi:cobalt/nickel transport protein
MSATRDGAHGSRRVSNRAVALGILLVALVLAGVVSFYAASSPDGLSKVSEDQGFDSTAKSNAAEDSPFAGYGASFVDDERLSGGLAGVVGVVVVLALTGGLTLVLRRRGRADDDAQAPADTTV